MENEVKKILIKFPREAVEVFNCFPFMVILSEEFPKAELNIIVEENCSYALSFLPFKVRVFERPAKKMSLIETHHYCANTNDIFNIDLFFDLEGSVNSAFMGFNFRAKERVGFEIKWNKYLLTKKFSLPLNFSIEKRSVKLLELFLNKDFSNVKISKNIEAGQSVENIEKLFKEPEPPKFIMILLDSFENVTRQIEIWKMFFDSFQNQKFIIWSAEDEDAISSLFASIDLGHNDLYMQKGKNSKEMIYLFSKVRGVVANNLWSEGLCTFMGLNFISIFDKDQKWPEYKYFRIKPKRYVFEKEQSIKCYNLDEIQEVASVNSVVDQLHFDFKL